MSDYGMNVYYYPEKSGLTIFAEIEYSSGSYEFDTRVVWLHKDGRYFTARDSGCSCPTPFEDYSLENLDRLDVAEIEREVQAEMQHSYKSIDANAAGAFLDKLRSIPSDY